MTFGNAYSSLFFDSFNPATGVSSDEPTAEFSVGDFFELPGEERQITYDIITALAVSIDGGDVLTPGMLTLLSYGIAYEDQEFKASIATPTKEHRNPYTDFLREFQEINPSQYTDFEKASLTNWSEYWDEPGVKEGYMIRAAASLIAAGAIGTISGVGLSMMGASPSFLVAGAIRGQAFIQSHAVTRMLAGFARLNAYTSVPLTTLRFLDRLENPEENLRQQEAVIADADQEEAEQMERTDPLEGLDLPSDERLSAIGIDRADIAQAMAPTNVREETERPVTGGSERPPFGSEFDLPPLAGEPDVPTNAAVGSSYQHFSNWDEVSLARFRRGEMTFGTQENPIPWVSAPAFVANQPGVYHIGAARHTLLTDIERAAEEASRADFLERYPQPGLPDIVEEFGYIEGQFPGYLNQLDVPDESYYFVPDDYTAYWVDNYGNGVWREPRYKSSSNQAYFSLRTFSPEYLATFQDQMVDAHLLREGTFLPGIKDQPTLRALETTMGISNVTGEWYKKVATRMAAAGREFRGGAGGYVRPPFVKKTYIKPDYEELSFAAKEAFRGKLGRDPHSWEMKLIADKLGSEHQRQFDVVEEARWKDYQRGTGGNKLTSETIEGLESISDVTMNYMDRKWAPEFERKERVVAERRGAQRFFGSMLQTDARITSGRSGATTQQVSNP